jgi:hypothetical protein
MTPSQRKQVEAYRVRMQTDAPPGTMVTLEEALASLINRGFGLVPPQGPAPDVVPLPSPDF